MDTDSIFKIWGERRRLLLLNECEIDLLYLKKNSFCSHHKHNKKINKFVVVEGVIRIETEFGVKFLRKNESWTVQPPIIHKFFAVEDSIMVELAWVEEGSIEPEDIVRYKQGGKYIEGRGNLTEDQMRTEGLLDL